MSRDHAQDSDYRYDLYDRAVETVDNRYGYSIEFSNSPGNHQADYDEEYERLMALAYEDQTRRSDQA